MTSVRFRLVLWTLWCIVSFGLGYATLNRYDPAAAGGAQDAASYRRMVTGETEGIAAPFGSRALVPYLARPVYWAARGRLSTWDAVWFSLLVVNAGFTATTATLLAGIGARVTGNGTTGVLAAALFLLNFAVANLQLAGLVDAAETCALAAVVWVLIRNAWWALPLIAIPGALAKETFVPIALGFAGGWWWASRTSGSHSRLGWVAAMGAAGSAVVIAAERALSSPTASPLDLLGPPMSLSAFAQQCAAAVFSPGMLYVFVWLLPLGVWRLRALPRTWVTGACVAAGLVTIFGAYADIGSNLARPLFNTLGPMLSLSAAWFVADLAQTNAVKSSR